MKNLEMSAAEIRAAVAKRNPHQHFPRELRARILEHARPRRRRGDSFHKIGIELGVSWRSIARWFREEPAPKRASFRRVEISAATTTPMRAVIVHPSGVRVENAAIAEIVEILRGIAS